MKRKLKRRDSRDDGDMKEIIEEARKFVSRNKGYSMEGQRKGYASPRITSEYMDCSMPMTFDHLSYCSLGCMFCFAYYFKSRNPSFSESVHSVDIKKIIKAIEGDPKDARGRAMYENFYKRKFLLHWGGLADPFCYFEHNSGIGYPLLECLGAENYPTLFSFKGSTIFKKKYKKLFERYSDQKNFAFQISMTTADNELSKKIEIGVPSPDRRLRAIKMLSDMGYYTILRLRPFIIGVTDDSLDELLERALEAGIQAISTEFFAVDVRSNKGMKTRYDWLAKIIGVDNLLEYFKALSPPERGGYMRLNRLVKEQYVKKMFKFCLKNNIIFACSDPDFKELNMSGSCCGMPDNYEPNPLLENWTRSQLTYHIKEARLLHHRMGSSKRLTFKSVYSKNETYLDDERLTNDHVRVSTMDNAEIYAHTYRTFALETWNNLRSPGNPRNYFHGKIMPVGLDKDGDMIYQYNPLEYEKRWVAEGIDLSIR